MYMFILWMCLIGQPNCPVYQSMKHFVLIFPAKSMAECEEQWKASLLTPDPPGAKSYHKCQPVSEDL